MHNSYYFIRQISTRLNSILPGCPLVDCFTQEKNELIFRFLLPENELFTLRATTDPTFSCLSFPIGFKRATNNTVDLFHEIRDTIVDRVHQFENERSFLMAFTSGFSILFKLFGNQSNVLLFKGPTVISQFRNNIVKDRNLSPDHHDKHIDWSLEAFSQHAEAARKHYFILGKEVWSYLEQKGYENADHITKWKLILSVREELENPEAYYLIERKGIPALSLLKTDQIINTFADPLEAANAFFIAYRKTGALLQLKKSLTDPLKAELNSAEKFIRENRERLTILRKNDHFKKWADLIMINLGNIDTTTDTVDLIDPAGNGERIQVPLKKGLSPQKNAEVYYRKSKNRNIEISKLEELIREKEEKTQSVSMLLQQIDETTDLQTLKTFMRENAPRKKEAPMPYHEHVFQNFRIWVGKNAAANDLLTFRHAHKNDVWLHARDVPGSHVVIKHQSGRTVPRPVIERAAALAAYHSKRKSETLCPVIVTSRKYVRKRKGDPPGTVLVDREEVILVTPAP